MLVSITGRDKSNLRHLEIGKFLYLPSSKICNAVTAYGVLRTMCPDIHVSHKVGAAHGSCEGKERGKCTVGQ